MKNHKIELTPDEHKQTFAHWTYFLETKKITWTPSLMDIFEISAKNLPTKTSFIKSLLATYVHGDDLNECMYNVNQLYEKYIPYFFEHRILTKDGKTKYLSNLADIMTDEKGTVIGFQGTIIDITDKKETEDSLSKIEQTLSQSEKVGGLGNWKWDIAEDQVNWSDQIFKIYGLDQRKYDADMELFRSIIHPEDIEKVNHAIKSTLENDTPFDLEHRIILKDGTVNYLVQHGELTRNIDGTPKKLSCTVVDATKLKVAERAASRSEIKLSEIFNIAPAAIITFNHEMKIRNFNKTAINIFGYQPEEVIGKHMNMLIPEEYRKTHHIHVDRYKRSNLERIDMEDRAGVFGVRKNGEMFPASAAVSSHGKGENRIFTVVMTDTTQRHKIEQDRIDAMNTAKKANDAKSEFLAKMSHELRTPLNALIGFSEMITNQIYGPIGNEKYAEYAKDINTSSHHLLNLVNDILDLSEIEAGKTTLNPICLPVNASLQETFFMVSKQVKDKNIECSFDIPIDIAPLCVDPRAFKQIIINVLNNAVKYTYDFGEIHISALCDNGNHIITVEDNGQGIPEDKLETILNPFNRVDNDPYTTQEGTGLGLAIVESLMKLHQGSIDIKSAIGVGTKVILTFPKAFYKNFKKQNN